MRRSTLGSLSSSRKTTEQSESSIESMKLFLENQTVPVVDVSLMLFVYLLMI